MNILIFGGTGTLGHAICKIAEEENATITIVSRCEIKQKQMAKKFPNIRFVLGSITEDCWKSQLDDFYDYVFNLAASKHVEVCESNVIHAVNINYYGTINTYEWAKERCNQYLFSSTDKGCLPINAYGASKMLAEKYLYNMNEYHENIAVFRWANIVGSRGSVLKLFKDSLLKENKVYVTDKRMTRLWAHIDYVARFMWFNKNKVTYKAPLIPEMKASTLIDFADALATILKIDNYDIEEIGIRDGEKLHECLYSSHDECIRSDTATQFTKDELIELIGSCDEL